jgi:hypothetical protein
MEYTAIDSTILGEINEPRLDLEVGDAFIYLLVRE